jgi:hypothetical protein
MGGERRRWSSRSKTRTCKIKGRRSGGKREEWSQPLSERRGSRRGERRRSRSRSKRRKCKIKGRIRGDKNGANLCLREEEAGEVREGGAAAGQEKEMQDKREKKGREEWSQPLSERRGSRGGERRRSNSRAREGNAR